MNFSADGVARKWSSEGAFLWAARWNPGVPTLAAVFLLLFTGIALAKSTIPLPRPRPADAPKVESTPTVQEAPNAGEHSDEAKPDAAEAKPPEPSACRLALTDKIAIAPSVPAIEGPGACGGDDLVRLEAVVISETQRVAIKPAAILRCTMATAIADWIRADMAPLASSLGGRLSELDNFDSFSCRGRNRVKGARLSEHGLANALDVRGLRLADGGMISLTDRNVARETREKVLWSVCSRFMTVLGPGSDWYHEDHIHLDLAERRNNYKICQWGVYDPLPAIAPLMPAERPPEAPPRPSEEEKPSSEKAAAAPSSPDEPVSDADEEEQKPSATPREKSSLKKTRQ